jgi:hypothetical protein
MEKYPDTGINGADIGRGDVYDRDTADVIQMNERLPAEKAYPPILAVT